jgi:hypothetical protein
LNTMPGVNARPGLKNAGGVAAGGVARRDAETVTPR